MNKASLCLENDAGLLFAYIRLYKTNREIREIRERNFQRIPHSYPLVTPATLVQSPYSMAFLCYSEFRSCSVSASVSPFFLPVKQGVFF